jgi:hypothetical protein
VRSTVLSGIPMLPIKKLPSAKPLLAKKWKRLEQERPVHSGGTFGTTTARVPLEKH